MKRHDLVDANDLQMPTMQQQMSDHAKAQESIAAITPDAQQKEQLQAMGLDSIIEDQE